MIQAGRSKLFQRIMLSNDRTLSGFQILQPVLSDRLFHPALPGKVDDFKELGEIKSFGANELVFEAADLTPGKVWIIEDGRAVLTMPVTPTRKPLVRITAPGDVIGVTETLACVPFRSSLRTLTPCTFQVLDHDSFLGFLRSRPDVGRKLLDTLSREYIDALQQLADVVACDHYHIPVDSAGIEWECNPINPWIHRN